MSESRSEFDAWWQQDRLRTWHETVQTRDRSPVPSEHWGEGFRRQSLIAYEAGRRAALEEAALACDKEAVEGEDRPVVSPSWVEGARDCAEAVRALAAKTQGE